MTERYYAEWEVPGQAARSYIKIYDFENTPFGWGFSSSDPQQLTIASDGIKIIYSGREDNVFEPIKFSTLELELIIQNDNQARLIDAARLTKEFNLGIEFGYYIGTSDATSPQWYGVLAPQSVKVDYGIDPYGASLTFTDGLQLLSEVSYRAPNGDPYETHDPLLLHLKRCFQYLPTLPMFPTNGGVLEYVTNIYHENHDWNPADPGPDVDVLYRTACNGKSFYTEAPRDNYFNNLFLVQRKTLSCLDVIQEIMTVMQLTLSVRRGMYMACSHFPYLTDTTFFAKYRYRVYKNDILPTPTHAPGTAITFNDNSWVVEEDTYDVMVGSKEGILPPAGSVSYVHRGGGSSGVFPRGGTHIIDVDFSNTLNFVGPRPNLGDFQSNQPGPLLGDFPKIDDEVDVPSGTGFRLRGRFRMRVRNPRNDFLNDPNDPVTRADEMIGAKIIVSMKIRVGNYYLRQTVTQLGADDFTDENDWGQIIIQTGAPGSSAAAPSYYYPIEHGDAEWTQNSADRFEFMVLHPDFTQPAVETLQYDDENGIVTEYPVGLWLKRQTDTVNKARYSTASYQEWLGESGVNNFIEWLDNALGTGNNSQYTNPVVESDIDLQLPSLPDSAGDQTGIEIDCSIRGYTAEGYTLYDSTVANIPSPSSNFSWLGNVLVGTPAWLDFEFFVGDASRSFDPMYSAEDDNPEGNESLLLGTTILGSRYDSNLGSLGYLTTGVLDENGGYEGYGSWGLGWNSVSLPQGANKGILQVCANIGMDYYGAAKKQYNLILQPRLSNAQQFGPSGTSGSLISPGQLFYFAREGLTLLVQKVTNDLHRGVIDMLAVKLDHDPRVITEYDTGKIRGFIGGGMAPVPGGQLFSHRSFVEGRKKGRSMKPAQVDKLSFINLNATNTGVDTITGFTAALTQVQLDKLAAITINSNGEITGLNAYGLYVLDADNINDTSTNHKFATSSQLNTIANNAQALTEIYTVFKESAAQTGGGGLFVNTSSTSESFVKVEATESKIQAGSNTAVTMTESSPGEIEFSVQTGATGSEFQATPMTIAGRTSPTVPLITVNGEMSIGRDVTFSNAGATITFTAGTSGIEYADLSGTPALAAVATTGSYTDLSNTPALATVATTGSFSDLTNKPTIPTATSQLTNDSGFITTDTNTNIGNTNLTLSADRTLTCGTNDLTLNNPGSFIITNSAGATVFEVAPGSPSSVQVNGNFNVDSAQVTGGSIRLEEANLLGSNYIELKAPISITNNVTLTFPDGAGTSGQVLQTNGSGTLTWTDKLGQQNPLVKGALTIGRITVGNTPKLYIRGEDDLAGVVLQAPEAISTDVTFTLPETDGTNGQVLQTDGSGNLSFATVSGGGGGGMTQTPFFSVSGRVQWSSSYAGKRMTLGNTSYGPFNWYLHSQLVNGGAQNYNAADAVDTTTKTMANYYIYNAGAAMPSDSKKVRVKFAGRFNNAIANGSGTVGFSIWHCANMTSGSYNSGDTIRLIAKSADITPTTSSLVVWEEEFVSSTAYSGGRIMIFCEHRSGTLSSTAYCYGNWQVFLES